jgi:hypothetical protein
MEPLYKPALFSIPLLGHSWLRQTILDPQQWAEAVCATTPVRICEPLIPYQGWGLWRLEQTSYENSMGESVLYLPPAPLRLENDVTSGVALNISPASLVSTALTMAGPEGLPAGRLSVFQPPAP